jgi:hypothetical protein
MNQRIADLLHALKYQHPSGITTWGHCQCGNPARGSGRCWACLRRELIDLGVNELDVDKYIDLLNVRIDLNVDIEDLEVRIAN